MRGDSSGRGKDAQDSKTHKEQPNCVIPAGCRVDACQEDAGGKRENADSDKRRCNSRYTIHESILPACKLRAEVAQECDQTAANTTCGGTQSEIVKCLSPAWRLE